MFLKMGNWIRDKNEELNEKTLSTINDYFAKSFSYNK